MKRTITECNTGLPGLDEILTGVKLGDNVVFKVDNINDYVRFVHPFAKAAIKCKKDLIYFRFSDHPELLPKGVKANTYVLHPETGFEVFISEILDVMEKFGKGAFYIFDCLSDLAVDWYSDRMLGNFFMIACPHLYALDTVAYFSILRDNHSSLATDAIQNTAQVVLEIYKNKGDLYVQPLKVDGRYSQTMYMLHKWEGQEFEPVTRSVVTSEILASIPQPWLDLSLQRRDIWTRNFIQAQDIIQHPAAHSETEHKKLFSRLVSMAITREPKLHDLAERYFDLADIVTIGKRMIGTGLIGGKSVGMLLARAIMRKKDKKWGEKLETHDSFFIGSDVFYTYLIKNKCWWLRHRIKDAEEGFQAASEARELILEGEFPEDIQDQFMDMLEYFGQSPIIVRSSSLLEDAYGNAFSGKYESVFCANQGTPEERLKNFMAAVRVVYASTMSKEALSYRVHWGLLDRDEQMALLVQRVSGAVYGQQYFPHIAGVGFSFNPFVWNKEIDPHAGMVRLVFGLGTRAVERIDDDYTRIVALNAPTRRPESRSADMRKYAQHKVDVLDLKENRHLTRDFEEVVGPITDFPINIFASQDEEVERYSRERGKEDVFSWVLTFDDLLSRKALVNDLSTMLRTLHEAYNYAVDVEFTVNFIDEKSFRINLLQCRPFQFKGNILSTEKPEKILPENILVESHGPVIGSSRAITIDRIIYVVPEVYGVMNESDRYSVARLVGKLTHKKMNDQVPTILLIGPGRWATTTPSLGVPVSFAEIERVSVLCEVAEMHEGLTPELSLGTHFFNDLVETNMLYFAIKPKKSKHILNEGFFDNADNVLTGLIPEAAAWTKAVKVIDFPADRKDLLCFNADVLKQNAVCYFDRGE